MAEIAKKSPETTIEKSSALVPPWMTDPWSAWREEMENFFSRPFGAFPSLRRAFETAPFRAFEKPLTVPAVDVVEDDKSFRINAELPGIDEKDVEIGVSGDMLTIKGEKSENKEEKDKNYFLSERRYGSFQRSFQLPDGVDRDKIAASFEKGVLTITLPKTSQAVKEQRKIAISKK